MWGGLWRWCHSLTFIGCPARTSFIPPPVCNLAHLQFASSTYCCYHTDFSVFPTIFANLRIYCMQASTVKRLQLLGDGSRDAARRRDCAVVARRAACLPTAMLLNQKKWLWIAELIECCHLHITVESLWLNPCVESLWLLTVGWDIEKFVWADYRPCLRNILGPPDHQ